MMESTPTPAEVVEQNSAEDQFTSGASPQQTESVSTPVAAPETPASPAAVRQPVAAPVREERSDQPRWDQVPPMSLQEAAWICGVSQDAFERIIRASGMDVVKGPLGRRTISLQNMLRVGYSLLGQRESQLAMLRIQLDKALTREKDLATVLQSGVALDDPLNITTATPKPEPKVEVKALKTVSKSVATPSGARSKAPRKLSKAEVKAAKAAAKAAAKQAKAAAKRAKKKRRR
ncbi:MAG: hypothetical protein HQL53_07325 [Magnetococcales bacterium]|nr:hypothetical protein [Magnetococcales bacterium]